MNDRPADGISTLDTMIQGLFRKERLYDFIHNFIYFPDTDNGKHLKVFASYPQYFGARKLLANMSDPSHGWQKLELPTMLISCQGLRPEWIFHGSLRVLHTE